jgi:brefeldin A-inhibited guanine nucleotide-exchange protein
LYLFTVDLNRLARDSLEYYVTLQSESHRDAWTSVLILVFTKFLKLNDEQVKFQII